MMTEVGDVFEALQRYFDTRVVVLGGRGLSFCSGADRRSPGDTQRIPVESPDNLWTLFARQGGIAVQEFDVERRDQLLASTFPVLSAAIDAKTVHVLRLSVVFNYFHTRWMVCWQLPTCLGTSAVDVSRTDPFGGSLTVSTPPLLGQRTVRLAGVGTCE